MTTFIYCRAGDEIGMGHAVRCGHLAKVLIDAGEDCHMVVIKCEPTIDYFKRLELPHITSEEPNLLADLDSESVRWIVDVMVNDDALLRRLRRQTRHLVVIVGVGYSITRDTHWIADQVVYQAPTSRFDGIPGEDVIAGLAHIIIDPAYAEEPSDDRELDVVSYFGGGFEGIGRNLIRDNLGTLSIKWKYLDNWPDGVREDMRNARFFVGSMGMAVYEALAADTYPVVVCRSEDHTIPAMRLESQGRLTLLGTIDQVSPNLIARKVAKLLKQRHFPKSRPVDGLGVYRVARKILEWQPLGR